MAALAVIGLLGSVLGIIQFGMDNFAAPDSNGSKITVAVGLDYKGGLDNAGGDLPDVRLFNEAGGFLGMAADPGDVDSGTAVEMIVPHDEDSAQQATYGLFSANDNAICVAYVTITWPDGNQYGWSGDWGHECGGSWYMSNVFIKGTDIKPTCLWIDKNGDQPQTGFQLHFPEFATSATAPQPDQTIDGKDKAYFCNNDPAFKLYTEPDPTSIVFWLLEGQTSKRSPDLTTANPRHPRQFRSTKPRPKYVNPHLDKLIIGNDTQQAASMLCESKTSLGPDFVDLASGFFCRMSDKTMWPICSNTLTDNCFSLGAKQLVVGGLATRNIPYKDIGDWTSGGWKE